MAKFMKLLGGHVKENKELMQSLQILDKNKVPIRMEIENSSVRFHTRLSIKSATVIIAKPMNMREGLIKGGTVRFKMPDSVGKEVRMEVLTPHFNLTNGNPVFLCKIPTSFAESNMRGSFRHNTSSFSNVQLILENMEETFRIVDLSTSGCKVFLQNKEHRNLFAIGSTLTGGKINLGNKVTVNLDSITPRNHRGQAVGCQISVSKEGHSMKYLHHLINSLDKTESQRMQA